MNDYMKTIISAIKTWVLGNRTHYAEPALVSVLKETTNYFYSDEEWSDYRSFNTDHVFEPNKEYTVTFDGIEYKCISRDIDGYHIFIGNGELCYSEGGNNEPFCIRFTDDGEWGTSVAIFARDAGEHTYSISTIGEVVHPLDEKFLPDTVATKKFVKDHVDESIVHSDWNQNDPEAPDYVKNRTHWVEPSVGFVLANDTYFHGETYTITVGSDGYAEQVYVDAGFVDEDGEREGGRFRVTWNDVEYEVNHGSRSENMIPELGYDRDDLPFTVGGLRSTTILTLNPELGPYAPGTYDVTVKIEYLEPDTYHKIPMEFMPRNLATVEYVDTNINAKAPNSHASSSTTYGRGNSAYYGHVKLSDATDSTSNAGSGVAASPKAVKAAYDLAKSALDGGAKIATGSYTPTNKSGVSDPNRITFDFVPEVVFILEGMVEEGYPVTTLFYTCPKALKNAYAKYGYMVLGGAVAQMSNNGYAKWDGNSLYWYANNTRNQMNETGYSYRYFAIG